MNFHHKEYTNITKTLAILQNDFFIKKVINHEYNEI